MTSCCAWIYCITGPIMLAGVCRITILSATLPQGMCTTLLFVLRGSIKHGKNAERAATQPFRSPCTKKPDFAPPPTNVMGAHHASRAIPPAPLNISATLLPRQFARSLFPRTSSDSSSSVSARRGLAEATRRPPPIATQSKRDARRPYALATQRTKPKGFAKYLSGCCAHDTYGQRGGTTLQHQSGRRYNYENNSKRHTIQ